MNKDDLRRRLANCEPYYDEEFAEALADRLPAKVLDELCKQNEEGFNRRYKDKMASWCRSVLQTKQTMREKIASLEHGAKMDEESEVSHDRARTDGDVGSQAEGSSKPRARDPEEQDAYFHSQPCSGP